MVTLYLISFARSFFASWLTGGCYRVFTWLCIVISAFKVLEKPLSCTRTSLLQSHFFLLAWLGMRPRGVAPPLSSVFAFLSLGLRKLASTAAASYILPHTFLFTTSLFLLHAHIHTHTPAQRGKSICVRHSARERQRHWVNYPPFTAAEKSRWQQTICKWQGAVNYSIFLD